MSIELPKLLFWKKPPDEAALIHDYQTRIAMISFRLKEDSEISFDQAPSQEISREKLPELVNGKGKYLKGEEASLPAIYAWVLGEKSWISIGLENKRITFLLETGEKPVCLLEKKLPSKKWGRAKIIEEVPLSEVEAIINFAENLPLRPLLGRPDTL